jgi:hypothetical protein
VGLSPILQALGDKGFSTCEDASRDKCSAISEGYNFFFFLREKKFDKDIQIWIISLRYISYESYNSECKTTIFNPKNRGRERKRDSNRVDFSPGEMPI